MIATATIVSEFNLNTHIQILFHSYKDKISEVKKTNALVITCKSVLCCLQLLACDVALYSTCYYNYLS